MRILIAESNELIGSLIRSVLEKNGHQIYLAEDGIEAFRMLNLQQFDLVITEILLPYYTGLEVLHYISSRENRPKTIVLSFVQNIDTVYKAYQLNADSYITKPFNPDRLPLEIEKLTYEDSALYDTESRIILDEYHLSEEVIQQLSKIKEYFENKVKPPELGRYKNLTSDDLWTELVLIFSTKDEEEFPNHVRENKERFKKFKDHLSLNVLLENKKDRENYISKTLREFQITKSPEKRAFQIERLLKNPMIISEKEFKLLNNIDHNIMTTQRIRNLLMERASSFNLKLASEFMVETGLSLDVIGLDHRTVRILQDHLRLRVKITNFENDSEIYESLENILIHACDEINISLAYLHKILKYSKRKSLSFILYDL